MNPALIGSSVDVVGTTYNQRGLQCDKHLVCGEALVVGSYVFFRKTRLPGEQVLENMYWRYTPLLMVMIARLDICRSIWQFGLMRMMACALVWWKSILAKVTKIPPQQRLLCCINY